MPQPPMPAPIASGGFGRRGDVKRGA